MVSVLVPALAFGINVGLEVAACFDIDAFFLGNVCMEHIGAVLWEIRRESGIGAYVRFRDAGSGIDVYAVGDFGVIVVPLCVVWSVVIMVFA